MLLITPLYAGVLALVLLYLSFNVIRLRRKYKISLQDGGNLSLNTAIRAHGNFIEYVPVVLFLMYFSEITWMHSGITHVIGGCLLSGRLLHAYGMSSAVQNLVCRVVGMVLTFSALLIAAVTNILAYFF